jgi:hypothetical protein
LDDARAPFLRSAILRRQQHRSRWGARVVGFLVKALDQQIS